MVEMQENTERKQLTPTEAEHAWQRYRVLLGVSQKQEHDTDGNFVAKPLPSGRRPDGKDPHELAVEATGYGETTLRRVAEIRETAEDEDQPEPVRKVAKEELGKLATGKSGVQSGFERVRQEKKRATRAAMAPGQRLKEDEPKAPKKEPNWRARLWDVVGSGKAVRTTAGELEQVTTSRR